MNNINARWIKKKNFKEDSPKTLNMVTTNYLSRNSHNDRIANNNCFPNNCGNPVRDASGNYIGTRQLNRLNSRNYYAPF